MNLADIALIMTALGLGAILKSVIDAVSQRRKVGADVVNVLAAAAKELVEPLRQELAAERAAHKIELAEEREQHDRELADEQRRVNSIRQQLDEALADVERLRRGLGETQQVVDELREQHETDKLVIRALEARLS